MKPFESFLALQLNDYLTYRQSLDYDRYPTATYLRAFDRYLRKTKRQWTLLQPSFFLEFRAKLTMEPRSVNSVLSATRNFFQYLVRRGYYPQNPLKDIALVAENAIIPFVFSPEQTEQLLRAICTRVRRFPEWFLKDLSVYLAVVLLARCGMRISEPVRLLCKHYRAEERTLYLEKTKFKKDRLIPVPESVALKIENYLPVRNAFAGKDQNACLLVGYRREKLKRDQIYQAFRQAVKEIGLDQPRYIVGSTNFSAPTPHSLRHSCAVRMLCAGDPVSDIKNHLGHEDIQSTMVYLQMDLTRRRQVQKKFLQYTQAILTQDPKIDELIDWQNRTETLAWLDSL